MSGLDTRHLHAQAFVAMDSKALNIYRWSTLGKTLEEAVNELKCVLRAPTYPSSVSIISRTTPGTSTLGLQNAYPTFVGAEISWTICAFACTLHSIFCLAIPPPYSAQSGTT